jgi:uncharacterized membrane protein
MSKPVKLAFLVSLVLNIILIGVILGHFPRNWQSGSSRQERIEKALRALPDPAQSHIREKLAQVRAADDPLQPEMDAARDEALRLLSAEQFDEAGYDRQINKIYDVREQMFKLTGQAIRRAAKELSPEERRMFADVLRRPSSR